MEDTLSTPSHPPARRIAIYPGTFDPIHNGHVDIARRAATLFDELIVAVVADRPAKRLMFNASERVQLVRESIGESVDGCIIRVETFSGLVVQYARERGARAIVRGLRAVTDFEYEYQMTTMNRYLESGVETVFLMTSLRFAYLSSTLLKEVAGLGADVDELVPHPVATALAERTTRAGQ
ncbi:MAG: pantetheine-phosphate adenylyltransferase [Chloroflexota bacterium]